MEYFAQATYLPEKETDTVTEKKNCTAKENKLVPDKIYNQPFFFSKWINCQMLTTL